MQEYEMLEKLPEKDYFLAYHGIKQQSLNSF